MTLYERKAIEWLKSLDDPLNPTEESYYAQLILAMIEGLGDRSVSDLLDLVNELEGKVEHLEDILDSNDIMYDYL